MHYSQELPSAKKKKKGKDKEKEKDGEKKKVITQNLSYRQTVEEKTSLY